MIRKKHAPPLTRRRFGSTWVELDYLCKKIHYWLYVRQKKGYAHRYVSRLERVLHELPDNDLAIIRQEGLALFCQLSGRISEAIKYRTREIELIKRLHSEAKSHAESTRAYMLQGRDTSVLQERRALLEALLRENSP